MPGNPTITLVRPDGSTIDASAEDAQVLQGLGYKPQSLEAKEAAAAASNNEAYYSTPGQKLKTAVEGFGSGVTLGLSDKMLEGMSDSGMANEDWRQRAQFNPGTRMGSEIVGAIAPAFLTGGESLATPVGALSAGAKGVGGLVEKGVGRSLLTGAVEGAGFGAGGAISQSALTGDPLTSESLLAGMGWGAVYGGGIGAIAGGAGAALEGRAARSAAGVEEALQKEKAASAMAQEKYSGVAGAARDAAASINTAFEDASSKVDEAVALKQPERAAAAVQAATDARQEYLNSFIKEGAIKLPGVRAAQKAAIGTYGDIVRAAQEGEFNALSKHIDSFTEQLKNLEQLTGIAAPEMQPFITHASAVGGKAVKELGQLGAIGREFKSISTTAEGFAAMSPGRAEKLFAATDSFMSGKNAEFEGLRQGYANSITALADHLGVAVEGTPSAQLRGIWEGLKTADKAGAKGVAESAVAGKLPWWKKGATYLGGAAGASAGHTFGPLGALMGYQAGKNLVGGLLALKGGVVGAVTDSASRWTPKVLRAVEKAAPRLEPLKVRLDGTEDKGRKDRDSLMAARAAEVREAAPTVRDTLYKSISPLTMEHPELAQGLHQQAVTQFNFLLNKLPKDPGNAYSRLQTLWKADPVEAEKWSRYYGVFQDPVGTMQRALDTMQVSPQEVEGLKEMWPALYTHLRSEMIERISEPGVMQSLSYNQQVRLGTLLDIKIHSTMTPQFITQQMQMFQDRSKPLNSSAKPGMGAGNGGRPSATDSPYATQAQKSTDR